MRFVLSLAAVAFAAPAATAEKLPIDGTFGDESGCLIANEQPGADENGVYITADEYNGWEFSCGFAWISEKIDDAWSIITVCHGEGVPHSELLTIEAGKDEILLSSGPSIDDVRALKRC